MLSPSRRRALRAATATAVVASLATTAVAVAQSGPSNWLRDHDGFGRHHVRYYRAHGWVVPSANATTLTVEDLQGRKHAFTVSTATKYEYSNGSAATASNAGPYQVVEVSATMPTTSSGNPVASTVVIRLTEIEGVVKSDTASTLTVADTQGFTRQISTSSATCAQRRTTVTCAGIATGSIVVARGSVASDGVTLDASRVQVITAGS
jgi:hypothetical protein